jgi:hypothetical protein
MKFKNMFKKIHRNKRMLPISENDTENEYESRDNFPFKVEEKLSDKSDDESKNWQGLVKNNVSLWNDISENKKVYFNVSSEQSTEANLTSHQERSTLSSTREQNPCSLCDNTNDTQLIVLECNHSFHIKCLAEIDHDDSKNYIVLDNLFFKERKCITCNYTIDTAELMYIHSKYTRNIKETINDCDSTIKDLEIQLRFIKEQMKKSFECKQIIEYSQNKSKQLIIMLNTEFD